MHRSPFAIASVAVAALLSGCGHQFPNRPYVDVKLPPHAAAAVEKGCRSTDGTKQQTTPEITDRYALHFVEFDDHGWAYESESTGFVGPRKRVGNAAQQLDCAIVHVASTLADDSKVMLYVYVHGWHHNAAHDDDDVENFRAFLNTFAKTTDGRKVIGIYVGWEGESMSLPLLKYPLTFFSRKASAHRIADGRVRELFGRIKGLREAHNRSAESHNDCSRRPADNDDTCPFRVTMIGHSFGGLILFSAVQPYLLQTLTATRDRRISRPRETEPGEEPRSRGIADLVVLLNPAFEASLFEPVFRASASYAGSNESPLLVSLTSTADWPVRTGFSLARNASTFWYYPANSKLATEALRDSVGNVGEYLTHTLCVAKEDCQSKPERPPTKVQQPAEEVMPAAVPAVVPVKQDPIVWRPPMKLCEMELHERVATYNKPLWNVITDKAVIGGHSDTWGEHTLRFLDHVFSLNTGRKLGCDVATQAARPAPP